MTYKAVLGLGFGDEGKGLFTDYLCSQTNPSKTLVIRFSGGQNSGHTIYLGNKNHVFSNFGSGTLRGIPTYWDKYCTFDPVGAIKEFNILKLKGIKSKIYVNSKCPITTPEDKFFNVKQDKDNNHGTCGVGIGTTHQREDNHYSLLFEDILNPIIFNIKYKQICEQYYKNLDLNCSSREEFFDSINYLRGLGDNFIKIDHIPFNYENYIYEGSQGLLLDQKIGFFPNVTRSNTDLTNIDPFCRENVYLVTRTYQTRHGNGPMTNEEIPHNIKVNPNEANKDDGYQGIFRRSLLDLDLLIYGIQKANISRNCCIHLVVTCLDHVRNDYRLTYRRNILGFSTEKDFIRFIVNSLYNNSIFILCTYLSRSPYSENIEIFKSLR